MAFNGDNLGIVVHAISGGTFRIASYETSDTIATVIGSGYFTNASKWGLKVNTIVVVYTGDDEPAYVGRINSITNDAGTLVIDQDVSQQIVSTAVDFTVAVHEPYTTIHTGTLTGHITATLATTGAVAGRRHRVVRTGTGNYLIYVKVGDTLLTVLPRNSWVDLEYNGSTWVVLERGFSSSSSTITIELTASDPFRDIIHALVGYTGQITINLAAGTYALTSAVTFYGFTRVNISGPSFDGAIFSGAVNLLFVNCGRISWTWCRFVTESSALFDLTQSHVQVLDCSGEYSAVTPIAGRLMTGRGGGSFHMQADTADCTWDWTDSLTDSVIDNEDKCSLKMIGDTGGPLSQNWRLIIRGGASATQVVAMKTGQFYIRNVLLVANVSASASGLWLSRGATGLFYGDNNHVDHEVGVQNCTHGIRVGYAASLAIGGTLTIRDCTNGITREGGFVVYETGLVFSTVTTNLSTVGTWVYPLDSITYKAVAETVAAANVIAASESGSVFFLNSGTEFASTLPAPAAGLHFRFIVTAAPSGADYTITTTSSSNIIIGHVLTTDVDSATNPGFTATGVDTISFVSAKAVVGDQVEVISDGTNWFATGRCSVFDAITFTTAS